MVLSKILLPAFIISAIVLVAAIFGQRNVSVAYKRKRMTMALIFFVVTFIVLTTAGFLMMESSGMDLRENGQRFTLWSLIVSIAVSVFGSKIIADKK
jgi:quinol-cytochrome oxidoreductase complex cytochrome b subunit